MHCLPADPHLAFCPPVGKATGFSLWFYSLHPGLPFSLLLCSSRLEHRARMCVCILCVCACACVASPEFTEGGQNITCPVLLNLVAGAFFHHKGNLLTPPILGHQYGLLREEQGQPSWGELLSISLPCTPSIPFVLKQESFPGSSGSVPLLWEHLPPLSPTLWVCVPQSPRRILWLTLQVA